jgi:hypothetical protein
MDPRTLKQLVANGTITPETRIWKNGMENWVPARRIKGLFSQASSNATPPPLQQQSPIPPQAVFQSQALVQPQAPVQLPTIVGLGRGTSSVNWFRFGISFWWLMIVYGIPITCRIPLAAGNTPENAVGLVTQLFCSCGFSMRTMFANLVSGNTLKCPGAVFAVRDVRVKGNRDCVEVIGYPKDIVHILNVSGLLGP